MVSPMELSFSHVANITGKIRVTSVDVVLANGSENIVCSFRCQVFPPSSDRGLGHHAILS